MVEQKRKPIGILLTVILISALLTVCLELGLSYLRPDTPGSLTKHLIHFAIMFVLFGGATLLCLFCPPFKKLWAWLDKHIMSQETRPIAIDIIYAITAGLMLLHHFYVLLYYPVIPAGATKFAPLWIVFATLTILLAKSWHTCSFWLVSIFLIFSFERLYNNNFSIASNDMVFFISAIYALFICINVFSVLRPSVRTIFLKALCALWATAILIMSVTGLFAAWTGIRPQNLVGVDSRVIRGRLYMLGAATTTASNLGCGVLMALIGFSISKRKSVKFLFLFVCLIAITANSLTDSRSSFYMLAFMIAEMICLGFWTIYRKQMTENQSVKKNALVITTLMICFYGAIVCQRYLGPKFIEIRNLGGVIPVARAEEPIKEIVQESTISPTITAIPPQFTQRDIWLSEESSIEDTFNGRINLWRLAFEYIHNHPKTLLYGVSVDGSVTSIISREDHSHNLLIQILLEGGLPALLLFLSLVFYGTYHAFRLWNRRCIPFWQRVLPLPVFSILLWEMAECLTHFSYGHPPMTLFWFFLGATITVSKSLGKAPKSSDPLTETKAIETGE